MAMQVGEHDSGEDVPMSDINTTPLVDVMLVLLIIFLITVPVVIQSVPITLPEVRNEPTETKKENVSLTVRGGPGGTCEVYWNLVPVTNEVLLERALIRLSPAGFAAFRAAIGAPAAPVPELVELLRRPAPWEPDIAG